MPLEGSDELLVNRSGATYTLEQQNLMAEILNDDLLLVNRSGATYTATGQELIDSVVPDLEIILTFNPNIPYIDEQITAVPITTGGVEPEAGYAFTYQWSIADDIDGTNSTNILGAVSSTYTPTEDQLSKFLGCTVQTTDARGTIANATARTGPIDYKPATDPPTILSVVLTQDQVNDKRFSDNSFTTTVNVDNRASQLAMEAEVVGALSLAIGSDVITTEDTDGKEPLDLTLASDTNLGSGRFEVGDVVKASASYTPETDEIAEVIVTENTWAGTQTGVAASGQMSNLWDGFSSTDTATHGCDVANSGDVRFTFDVPVPVTPGTWGFYNSGGANYTNIFSWEDDNGVHNMSGDPSGQIHGSGWGWDNFSPQPVGAIKWVQIGNSPGFGIANLRIDTSNINSAAPQYQGSTQVVLSTEKDINKFQPNDKIQQELTIEIDDSQIWSNNLTGAKPDSSLFDFGQAQQADTGSTLKLTFSPALTGSIEFHAGRPNDSSRRIGFEINGTDQSNQINQDFGNALRTWNSGASYSGINTLEWSITGSPATLITISSLKIGGKWLMDPGNTPGPQYYNYTKVVDTDADNKTINVDGGKWDSSNQSQVWSELVTAPGIAFNPTWPPALVYNGKTDIVSTERFIIASSSPYNITQPVTFQLPGLTAGQEVEFLGKRVPGGATTTFNGTTVTGIFESNGIEAEWNTLGTSIEGTNTIVVGVSAQNTDFYAIRVGGRLLIDPVNASQVWSTNYTSIVPQNASLGFDDTDAYTSTTSAPVGFYQFNAIPNVTKVVFEKGNANWGLGHFLFADDVDGNRYEVQQSSDGVPVTISIPNKSIVKLGGYPSGGGSAAVDLWAKVSVNGELLLDVGRDSGDNKVSTITPKQGQGTISAINDTVVSISPFTDNCFVNGQYLIHASPKPIKITPVTEVINNVNTTGDVLTFAGNDELIEFAAGDSVTMCDANGNPVEALIETDTINDVDTSIDFGTSTVNVSGWSATVNAIKGGTSTRANNQNSTAGRFTFNPPVPGVRKVRAATRILYNNSEFSINGVKYVDNAPTQPEGTWITVYDGPPITMAEYQQVVNGTSDDFTALEVNDIVLDCPDATDGGNNTASGTWTPENLQPNPTLTFDSDLNIEYFKIGDLVQVGEVSFSPGNMNGYNALDQAGVNNMFDGNLSTETSILSQATYPGVVPNSDAFTVVLPVPIENVTKVEVYGNGSSNTNTDAWINDNADPDSNTISSESNAWYEIYNGAAVSLTKLRFATATSNGGMSIRAARVNGGSPLVYSGDNVTVLDTDVASQSMVVSGGKWDTSNQSQVWSAGTSTNWFNPVSVIFDGDLTTDTWNASGNVATLAFTGLTAQSSIKAYFYTGATNDLNNNYWQINNRNISLLHPNPGTSANAQWVDVSAPFTFPVDITELSARGSSNGGMMALMVDGKVLVDAVNDSQVWSDLVTVTGGWRSGDEDITSAFDGNDDYSAVTQNTGELVTIDLSGAGLSGTLVVNVQGIGGSTAYVRVNDDDAGKQPYPSTDGGVDFGNVGAINKIELVPDSNLSLNLQSIVINGKRLVDPGARGLGDTTVKTIKAGTGVVGSVDVPANIMTLSTTNGEWIPGYYATTPEKNAVEMRGYLSFDSEGNNVNLERLPVSPVLMDETVIPKLTFPSTFSTGEGVDTDLPYPTYMETYVVASNALGSSARVKSNEMFPDWTGNPFIAANSYRVMQDEFADWCYWACSSDYRSAIKTIQDAEATVQQLRTKADNLASDFLNRDDVY